MGERIERSLERRMSFTEKLAAAQNKAAAGQPEMTSWGTRAAPSLPVDLTAKFEAASRGFGGGTVGGMRIAQEEIDRYKAGLAAIAEQQGITQERVHVLIKQHVLDYHYVIAAAKEAHQDQMRDLREEDEARRAHAEFLKTAA